MISGKGAGFIRFCSSLKIIDTVVRGNLDRIGFNGYLLVGGSITLLLKGGEESCLHGVCGGHLNQAGALFVLNRPFNIGTQRGLITECRLISHERHHSSTIACRTRLVDSIKIRVHQHRSHHIIVGREVMSAIVEVPIEIVGRIIIFRIGRVRI